MTSEIHPYTAILTADEAIAYLNSDEVVALRIRGRPYVERFERIRHRPGHYVADVISANVVEVVYDSREPALDGRNLVVTGSLFLRPEDADAVRREFPQCCEPVAA